MVWSRPKPTARCAGFSRSRAPTRSPATRSTPASTCSSRTPSIAFPKDVSYSIERGYFPSLVERRRAVRRVRRSRLLDRHRHAGEVHPGAPGHVRRAVRRRPVRRGRSTRADRVARCARRRRRPADAPCFIDSGAQIKAGAVVGPYAVIGRGVVVEEEAQVTGSIIWPNTRIGQHAAVEARSWRATATSAATSHCAARRCSATRRCSTELHEDLRAISSRQSAFG